MGWNTVSEAASLATEGWFAFQLEEKKFKPALDVGIGADLKPQIYIVHGEFVVGSIQVLLGFPSELSF